MLNTKAEQFAPFVRRVAMRVFENFCMLLRRSIDARSAESVEEYAIIEAVMDKQGRLLSIQTEGPLRQRRRWPPTATCKRQRAKASSTAIRRPAPKPTTATFTSSSTRSVAAARRPRPRRSSATAH